MSEEVGHFFKAAEEIALKAGEYVAQKWHQPRNVNEKSSNVDLVTEVDVAVEKQIITHLSSLFPTHKFIGEESCNGHEEPQTDDPTWIIDPIDGTTNFVYRKLLLELFTIPFSKKNLPPLEEKVRSSMMYLSKSLPQPLFPRALFLPTLDIHEDNKVLISPS
eukprot:TRINITY_DN781_c0_g1_i1.p1 TRINITY_DN781_c0_g1~~TRINITY_DN781_c0_g1_i1.p1  ORF type:complete len:162 (+),score=27.85 TRINITY_DN781_c0_g1_i1:95-580(+)